MQILNNEKGRCQDISPSKSYIVTLHLIYASLRDKSLTCFRLIMSTNKTEGGCGLLAGSDMPSGRWHMFYHFSKLCFLYAFDLIDQNQWLQEYGIVFYF